MLSTTACRATGITRDTLYQPEALSMLMVETETIPRIDGRVKSSSADAARALYGDGFEYPPKWQGGRYAATLVKENGQWHVRSLTLLAQVDE